MQSTVRELITWRITGSTLYRSVSFTSFYARTPAVDRLTQQRDHAVLNIAAGAEAEELDRGRFRQPHRIVEVTELEQTRIETDRRLLEFVVDSAISTFAVTQSL